MARHRSCEKCLATAIMGRTTPQLEYADAVFDQATGRWVSRPKVAEIPFTAFAAQKHSVRVPGRLVLPHPRPQPACPRRSSHAVRHLAAPRVLQHHRSRGYGHRVADKTHRGHAIIEQVHADLKAPPSRTCPAGRLKSEDG